LNCLHRLFPLHVTVCCKPRDRLRQKPRENAERCFCQSVSRMPVDDRVCSSFAAVLNGGVLTGLNFVILSFDRSTSTSLFYLFHMSTLRRIEDV